MTCADCPHAEKVAYYESELGLRRGVNERAAVMSALGLTRTQAAVLLVLYAARGRVVPHDQFAEAMYGHEDRSEKAIPMHISALRAKLGKRSVLNAWHEGYRLSPDAVERVDQILGA